MFHKDPQRKKFYPMRFKSYGILNENSFFLHVIYVPIWETLNAH